MNHPRPLMAGIVILACLSVTVIRLHAGGGADQPAPPVPSERAVASVERTPSVSSLSAVLRPEMFRHRVEAFNRGDRETVVNHIPNAEAWDWFCLDRVPCHGRLLTVVWDRDGMRYGRGPGLQLFVDGQLIARGNKLERLVVDLPRH